MPTLVKCETQSPIQNVNSLIEVKMADWYFDEYIPTTLPLFLSLAFVPIRSDIFFIEQMRISHWPFFLYKKFIAGFSTTMRTKNRESDCLRILYRTHDKLFCRNL